jgi:hypothetical protein
MNTPSELEIAIAEFFQIQENLKQHPVANQYRCYYRKDGSIMDIVIGPPWPELDFDYIDITKSQADQCTNTTTVVNKELVFVDFSEGYVVKLLEDSDGEHTAVTNHMAIIVEPNEAYNDVTRYTKKYT